MLKHQVQISEVGKKARGLRLCEIAIFPAPKPGKSNLGAGKALTGDHTNWFSSQQNGLDVRGRFFEYVRGEADLAV